MKIGEHGKGQFSLEILSELLLFSGEELTFPKYFLCDRHGLKALLDLSHCVLEAP